MTAQDALQQYMEFLRDVEVGNAKLFPQRTLVYAGIADFVLKHGSWWTPAPLPKGRSRLSAWGI